MMEELLLHCEFSLPWNVKDGTGVIVPWLLNCEYSSQQAAFLICMRYQEGVTDE